MTEQPVEQEGQNTQRGLWDRIKERFKTRPQTSALLPSTSIAPIVPDESDRIQLITQQLREENNTSLGTRKEVSLDTLDFRKTIPIGWEALKGLSKTINELKDDPVARDELAHLTPSRAVYPAIPMVASVIAHSANPDIPVTLPTSDQVKAMKPWLRNVSRVIGKFSVNWKRGFDQFVERKGAEVVRQTGEKAAETIEAIGSVKEPRDQFVREIAELYKLLAKREVKKEEGFFGEAYEIEVPIEDKIAQLLQWLHHIRDGGRHMLLTRESYPLLTTLLPVIHFPSEAMMEDSGTISIAGAELMSGIEAFLQQEGVNNIPRAPLPRKFDLFNPATWPRGFTEWFAADKLERVRNAMPLILQYARNTLPENSDHLKQSFYTLAENIVIAKQQGKSDEEIAKAIFSK